MADQQPFNILNMDHTQLRRRQLVNIIIIITLFVHNKQVQKPNCNMRTVWFFELAYYGQI